MKVFEVITEESNNETLEISTSRQYVTSEDNSLLSVTEYFTHQCSQLTMELTSVREILTVSNNITTGKSKA